jgi:hypothetical protein
MFSVYYGLTIFTCFEYYLVIIIKHCIHNNWYILCILCQLAAVAYWGGFKLPLKFRSFDKAEPNFQFRGIYIRNSVNGIWVSFICKLSGTPDKGATAPSSLFSLCPLSSTEFVEPPQKKFLGTLLSGCYKDWSSTVPIVVYAVLPDDEQIVLETCRGC